MSIDVLEETKLAWHITEGEVKRPRMRAVVMLNDDYTPMEFVVEVLQEIFNMDEQKSTKVMMQVHYEGKAVCGHYPADIAETKSSQAIAKAREANYPLLCRTEIV